MGKERFQNQVGSKLLQQRNKGNKKGKRKYMATPVVIPHPIQVLDGLGRPAVGDVNPETGQRENDPPWTLYRFVLTFVISDTKWGKGVEAAHAGYRVATALKMAKPGETITFDTADWDRCKKVVREPEGQWPMQLVIQFTPFLDAITKSE